MKRVFKKINNLERKYIQRRHRKTAWYFYTKIGLLLPLLLIGLCEVGLELFYNKVLKNAYTFIVKGRIEREDKPDIVFKNIVAGFAGLAFPDEKTEILAKRRAEMCATCPFAVPSGIYNVVADNRTKQIQGMKCSECGCNLSAKVRSIRDYCPIGKW